MKIKRLKYKNHPILGNLELDFTTAGDRPYDSVIFAGNNGCGKTTILDSISTFLNRGSFEYFDYIEYMTTPVFDYKAVQRAPLSNPKFFAIIKPDGERINIDSGGSSRISRLDHEPINLRSKGCATSKARAEYNTEKMSSVKEADNFILSSPLYNPAIHHKEYAFAGLGGHTATYESLPTYIRNCIDHPDASHSYTAEEFERSIMLLIELLK